MGHSHPKSSNIITLTTDFGSDSPYVAEMKGAILSIDTSIQIVDGTHSIQPQNILQGSLGLRQIADAFPPGTVHVAVVDPGVGTSRRILLIQSAGQYFVAPDNGLLTFWLSQADLVHVVDQANYWRNIVSPTFHGRDIMTPVAAHLCCGVPISELSSPTVEPPVRLSIPAPRAVAISDIETEILAEALTIDSFGNVLTNVSMKELEGLENIRIHAGEHVAHFHATYGSANYGELICLIGSSGWLELAINGGSAADKLLVESGQPLRILGSQAS